MEVAVIGAGAAGLVAARELVREGHSVVVYEQGRRIGGTWVYEPEGDVDQDWGIKHFGGTVHSSTYKSLRANLPRELMGFLDYPFVARASSRDRRRFPGHEEVLAYLDDFASEFELLKYVRFNTRVTYVGKAGVNWIVESTNSSGVENKEVFGAVVVCNGHYFQPRIVEIPGIDRWPGKQFHSHNYRTPDPFKDQVVAVIGNSASGDDISKDIADVCRQIHWCARSWDPSQDISNPLRQGKILRHLMVERADEDGTLHFGDGCSAKVDIILHCTGYLYEFPFLDTGGYLTVDDNRVGPLYMHVFPPALAPSLSFVCLPCKIVPFLLSELQAKWIAAVLRGRVRLPTESEMMDKILKIYDSLEAQGVPKRRTHDLSMGVFDYGEWLAKECGLSIDFGGWRQEMFAIAKMNRLNPDFRDIWVDDELHQSVTNMLMKQLEARKL